MPMNEADTCQRYVLPKLYNAGREDTQVSAQKSFTDGRIVFAGSRPLRRPQKRADYIPFRETEDGRRKESACQRDCN